MKTYRDINNSIDTAGAEVKIEGKIETVKLMLSENESIDKTIKFMGLT